MSGNCKLCCESKGGGEDDSMTVPVMGFTLTDGETGGDTDADVDGDTFADVDSFTFVDAHLFFLMRITIGVSDSMIMQIIIPIIANFDSLAYAFDCFNVLSASFLYFSISCLFL